MTKPRAVQLDLFDGRRRKTVPAPAVAPEAQEQEALIAWAALHEPRYPELALLLHIPNGGWRHPSTGAALKRRGVRPGVPDLLLPVGRCGRHGLWIELKRRGKKAVATQDQQRWLAALETQGYAVAVCHGWEAAAQALLGYLEGPARCARASTTGRWPRGGR